MDRDFCEKKGCDRKAHMYIKDFMFGGAYGQFCYDHFFELVKYLEARYTKDHGQFTQSYIRDFTKGN